MAKARVRKRTSTVKPASFDFKQDWRGVRIVVTDERTDYTPSGDAARTTVLVLNEFSALDLLNEARKAVTYYRAQNYAAWKRTDDALKVQS